MRFVYLPLAQFGEVCGGVWRQSDRNCSKRSRKHTASLPLALSGSWQRKAIQWVRWCQTFARVALPVLHPTLPVSIHSFHPALVFSRGLRRNWPAFPPGEQLMIGNENYRSFSELSSVKAWACSKKIKKIKNKNKQKKCHGELMKELGHTLPTKWKGKSDRSKVIVSRSDVDVHQPVHPSFLWNQYFSGLCVLFLTSQYLTHVDLCQHQISPCYWLFKDGGGSLSDDAYRCFHSLGYSWGWSCSSEIWACVNIFNAAEVKLYKHIILIVNPPELKTGLFVKLHQLKQISDIPKKQDHNYGLRVMWNGQAATFKKFLHFFFFRMLKIDVSWGQEGFSF